MENTVTKRNKRKKQHKLPRIDRISDTERAAGPEVGNSSKFYGRGASIRIVTPEGAVVQTDPRVYRSLTKQERRAICEGILAAC